MEQKLDPNSQKKVFINDSLDCKNRGYKGLKGEVLKERYKFVKQLTKGAYGQIYMIEDLKNNRKMAMKVQEDQDMTSNEIGAMRKISDVFDANKASQMSAQEINYDATPRVSDYGLFKLVNFGEIDAKKDSKTVAFYIMPLYEMNLQEYLDRF